MADMARIVDGELIVSAGGNPKVIPLPDTSGDGPEKALDLATILLIIKMVMSLLVGLGVIPNIPLPELPSSEIEPLPLAQQAAADDGSPPAA